jgi:hypothetical protein
VSTCGSGFTREEVGTGAINFTVLSPFHSQTVNRQSQSEVPASIWETGNGS